MSAIKHIAETLAEAFPALDGFIAPDEWVCILAPRDGGPPTIIGNGTEADARAEYDWRAHGGLNSVAIYLIGAGAIVAVAP